MNQPRIRQPVAVGFAVIVFSVVAVLGTAVWSLPTASVGLSTAVADKLGQSGVKNPVTAVLLNFRGYDTLLELTVLFLALLGARALARMDSVDLTQRDAPISPVLLSFIRTVAPVMILVAGYLLWVGGHAPGGAFQAGAIVAALGVILKLGRVNWTRSVTPFAERLLLAIGLTVFLAIGIGTMTVERHLLEYSPSSAKWLILAIETAATISIAAILLALFCGGTILEHHQTHKAGEETSTQ